MVYFGKKQGGGQVPANAATKDGNNVFTGTNTFNAASTFNENVNVLKDKVIQMGWQADTPKLKIGGANGNNDGFIVAPSGDLRVNEGGHGRVNVYTDIVMNNKYITGLHAPDSDTDAANKAYCDTKQAKFNLVSGTPLATGNVINGKNEYIYYWEGDVTSFSADFALPGINNCYSVISGTVARRQQSGTWVTLFLRDDTNGVQTNVKDNHTIAMWIENVGTGGAAFDSKSIRVSLLYLATN